MQMYISLLLSLSNAAGNQQKVTCVFLKAVPAWEYCKDYCLSSSFEAQATATYMTHKLFNQLKRFIIIISIDCEYLLLL